MATPKINENFHYVQNDPHKCKIKLENSILISCQGFFDMFRFGDSIFIVSQSIITKFCTAIEQQSVSLNMKRSCMKSRTS